MQPQLHELNGGPWEKLEEEERTLARAGKEVYLIAGGIFDEHVRTIGRGVAVPRANFKILVVLEANQGARAVTDSHPR